MPRKRYLSVQPRSDFLRLNYKTLDHTSVYASLSVTRPISAVTLVQYLSCGEPKLHPSFVVDLHKLAVFDSMVRRVLKPLARKFSASILRPPVSRSDAFSEKDLACATASLSGPRVAGSVLLVQP